MVPHGAQPGGLSPFPRTGGFLAATATLAGSRGSARGSAGDGGRPVQSRLIPSHWWTSLE